MYVRTYACAKKMGARTYVNVCMPCMYVCCMYVYIDELANICMYVCMYVCVHRCVIMCVHGRS